MFVYCVVVKSGGTVTKEQRGAFGIAADLPPSETVTGVQLILALHL